MTKLREAAPTRPDLRLVIELAAVRAPQRLSGGTLRSAYSATVRGVSGLCARPPQPGLAASNGFVWQKRKFGLQQKAETERANLGHIVRFGPRSLVCVDLRMLVILYLLWPA